MNREKRRRRKRQAKRRLGRDEAMRIVAQPRLLAAQEAQWRGEHIANPKEGKAGKLHVDKTGGMTQPSGT